MQPDLELATILAPAEIGRIGLRHPHVAGRVGRAEALQRHRPVEQGDRLALAVDPRHHSVDLRRRRLLLARRISGRHQCNCCDRQPDDTLHLISSLADVFGSSLLGARCPWRKSAWEQSLLGGWAPCHCPDRLSRLACPDLSWLATPLLWRRLRWGTPRGTSWVWRCWMRPGMRLSCCSIPTGS